MLLTEKVSVKVPAVVGVPEITPVEEEKLSPEGRPETLSVLVAEALLKVMVCEKGFPVKTFPLEALVNTGKGHTGEEPLVSWIITESVAVAVPLLSQVKVIVTGVESVG